MMNNRVLSLYDWFLIVGVIASNVIYTLLTGNLDIVGSVAGIAGVFCVHLIKIGPNLFVAYKFSEEQWVYLPCIFYDSLIEQKYLLHYVGRPRQDVPNCSTK